MGIGNFIFSFVNWCNIKTGSVKKRLSVSLVAILSSAFLVAQVTLTYAVHGINPGDSCYNHPVDTTGINPGPGGANQTWNFSNAIIDVANFSIIGYISPGSTPYAASFPNANLAIAYSPGFYGYYNSQSTAMDLEGVANSTATIVNSNTQLFSQFPFTYPNSFSDNFYSAYMVASTPYVRDGVDTITADGYGTILFPAGSVPVLREKIVQYLRDSSASYVVHYKFVTYQWYSAADKFALFAITYSTTSTSASTTNSKTVYMNSTVLGIEKNELPEMGMNLFPDPATDNANIHFTLMGNQQINILVCDLMGKTILEINRGELSAGEYSETLQLSSLSKGMYLVKVQGDKSSACKKLILE